MENRSHNCEYSCKTHAPSTTGLQKTETQAQLQEKDAEIEKQKRTLQEKDAEIERQKRELRILQEKDAEIEKQKRILQEKDAKIERQKRELGTLQVHNSYSSTGHVFSKQT